MEVAHLREMSQGEVYNLLKEKEKPLSAREIAEEIDLALNRVMHSLKKMLKYKEIKFIEIDRIKAMKRFHCKRRMRLYYVK